MNLIAIIRNRILQLARENNFTINGLAEHCGLAPMTLKNIVYKNTNNPGIRTIKILCDGLGITLAEFFDTKEFNGLEQEIV